MALLGLTFEVEVNMVWVYTSLGTYLYNNIITFDKLNLIGPTK